MPELKRLFAQRDRHFRVECPDFADDAVIHGEPQLVLEAPPPVAADLGECAIGDGAFDATGLDARLVGVLAAVDCAKAAERDPLRTGRVEGGPDRVAILRIPAGGPVGSVREDGIDSVADRVPRRLGAACGVQPPGQGSCPGFDCSGDLVRVERPGEDGMTAVIRIKYAIHLVALGEEEDLGVDPGEELNDPPCLAGEPVDGEAVLEFAGREEKAPSALYRSGDLAEHVVEVDEDLYLGCHPARCRCSEVAVRAAERAEVLEVGALE